MRKTIKSLEARIAQMEQTSTLLDKAASEERIARYKAEQAQAGLVTEKLELEREVNRLKRENRNLELQLREEDARAEAFEFVLRLQHGAPVVAPPPEEAKAGDGVGNHWAAVSNATIYGVDWAKKGDWK